MKDTLRMDEATRSVKVPIEQYIKLRDLAKREGRTQQWLIARAIELLMIGYPKVKP